jgi:cytochrome P450
MINKIEYLDMVVNETLRIHPPVVSGDRLATADYKYENYIMPKGITFMFDIWVGFLFE